jgi:hypothetical protein
VHNLLNINGGRGRNRTQTTHLLCVSCRFHYVHEVQHLTDSHTLSTNKHKIRSSEHDHRRTNRAQIERVFGALVLYFFCLRLGPFGQPTNDGPTGNVAENAATPSAQIRAKGSGERSGELRYDFADFSLSSSPHEIGQMRYLL